MATGACGTTCFSDAACGVGNWCDDVGHAGVCEPKLANGQTVPGSLCTVPLGARACTAGVCDPDAACGYANGHGPCALADQATVCRSALCSVSLACRPAGGCLVDGDCSSVQFCNTQTFACTARIANGVALPMIAGHDPVLDGTCSAAVGTAVCQANVCSADNSCGYANGVGPCTSLDAAVLCRSGSCSVSLACKPVGGCLVDADCASTDFCNTQTLACITKIANGSPLPTIAGHAPNLDGTCSTAVGTAVCQAGVCDVDNSCGYANRDGPCTSMTALTLCRSGSCSVSLACKPASGCLVDADCTSTDFCNTQSLACTPKIANGFPVPTILGHAPNLDGTCSIAVGVAVCVVGVCDTDDGCGYADGHGSCTVLDAIACRSGACSVSGICRPAGGCLIDEDCATGQFCDTPARLCAPKVGNGGALPQIPGHSPVLDGTCTSAAAVATCVSGVCDTDGNCGHGIGRGPCNQLTATTVCRSGACSVSFVCMPGGGCLVDGDCSAGQFCNTQTDSCSPKIVNGISIPTIAGHTPALSGTCSPDAGSAVCVSAVCDLADNACGFGNGHGVCSTSNAGTVCRLGVCDVDAKCGLADGSGPCTSSTAAVCRSAVCSVSGACQAGNGCLVDGDCASVQFCNTETRLCVGKLTNGSAIPALGGHAPALTGTCTADVGRSVCVSGVCDSQDNACGYVQSHGPCTTLNAAVCRSGSCSLSGLCRPPNGCLVDGDCGSDEFCNTETSTCTSKIANSSDLPIIAGHSPPLLGTCSVEVGTAVCASGICDVADNKCGFANGDGTCAATPAPQCRSLVCDQGQCGFLNGNGPCANNAQCISNKCDATSQRCTACLIDPECSMGYCNAASGTCKPAQPNGAPCDRATQCQSVCFSDGLCGKPDEQSCTSATDCRSAVCANEVCGVPGAGVPDGGAPPAGTPDGGGPGASPPDDGGTGTDASSHIATIHGGGCSCSTTKEHDGDRLAALGALLALGIAIARRRAHRSGETVSHRV